MKKAVVYVFGMLLLLAGVTSRVNASCGSATCPLNNHHYLKSGWLHLMFTHEYINQDQIFVGTTRSYIGALPNAHDEVQTINERNNLLVQYGITDAFAANVELPFVHREHRHIAGGNTESFNFSGLGDIIVSGQYALHLPAEEFSPYLSVQAGVKLRSGMVGAASTDGVPAEVTIQPGTGSTDAILGLNYRQTVLSVPNLSSQFSALPLIFGISYQMNGRGTDDYRVGNTLLAHAGTEYQFLNKAAFLLQVNGMIRDFADVGTTGEFRQNTGGTWIFVSPGLSLQLNETFAGFAYIQIPVYQNVHGIQQVAQYNLLLGVTAGLDLLE